MNLNRSGSDGELLERYRAKIVRWVVRDSLWRIYQCAWRNSLKEKAARRQEALKKENTRLNDELERHKATREEIIKRFKEKKKEMKRVRWLPLRGPLGISGRTLLLKLTGCCAGQPVASGN